MGGPWGIWELTFFCTCYLQLKFPSYRNGGQKGEKKEKSPVEFKERTLWVSRNNVVETCSLLLLKITPKLQFTSEGTWNHLGPQPSHVKRESRQRICH